MSERVTALALAHRLLDDVGADPNDDLRVLSRQLIRRTEMVEALQKRIVEMSDNTLDLINANRDTILRIHEEGVAKINKIVRRYVEWADGVELAYNSIHALDCAMLHLILRAINTFHPMHGESWSGWPEGS